MFGKYSYVMRSCEPICGGLVFLLFFPPRRLIVKDPAGGSDCAEY